MAKELRAGLDELREKYDLLLDSALLIREDRDSRG